jgi:hypothetical protein
MLPRTMRTTRPAVSAASLSPIYVGATLSRLPCSGKLCNDEDDEFVVRTGLWLAAGCA